jgi:hypothetical protein
MIMQLHLGKKNMKLCELVNQNYHPIFQQCSQSPIWDKPAEDITNIDLLMLYTRVKNDMGAKYAQKGVDLVYKKILEAFDSYNIEAIRCKKPKAVKEFITMPEIIKFMRAMTLWQRRAFLFSLHSGLTPTEASRLTWANVFKLELCDAAIDVLECQVRHIRISNVFYDSDTQQVLGGLEAEIYHITKIKWDDLQERFNNVILVDHGDALKSLSAH